APDLLDLIAPEREGQPAGVLEDVARERHGEVEVESELGVAGVLAARCEPAHGIDLLVGVATLADEAVDRLNRPRLDGGESMQLEHLTDGVEEVQLEQPLGGQQLRESGERGHLGGGHGYMSVLW